MKKAQVMADWRSVLLAEIEGASEWARVMKRNKR